MLRANAPAKHCIAIRGLNLFWFFSSSMTSRSSIAPFLLMAVFLLAASWSHTGDAGIVPKESAGRFELIFWDSIKDSDNPADYEAYLEAYPDGRFAPLAKVRVRSLREQKKGAEQESKAKIEMMDREFDVVRNASLREGPDSSTTRLATLNAGTRVVVTGRVVDANWYRVETSDGQSGFVFGKLLKEAGAPVAKQEPVAAATATATVAPAPEKKPEQVAKAPEPEKVTAPPPPPPPPEPEVKSFKDCPTCPEMVELPPGSFVMGSKAGDSTENPVHRVTIDYPIAMGRYEVTVAQWKVCHDAGGCEFMPSRKGMKADMPVYNLSWQDAAQYVAWLSKTTGKKYRLPSEAEWEYAARAGTETEFWWGDDVGEGNADCRDCGGEWSKKTPAEVDTYPPNAFGLHGMNGGVWEWGADCWFDSHEGAPADGSSRSTSGCQSRILRGGAWRNNAGYARSASRFTYDFDVRYILNGFRVVRSMK
jgi:formylglycine-generating enzyme required for sulfatase activity